MESQNNREAINASIQFHEHRSRLIDIEVQFLLDAGVRGVILDLNNTIISEDDVYLSPYVEPWISELTQNGIQFFLLSNGKKQQRARHWSDKLKIPIISRARKPLPFAFWKALRVLKLPAQCVVVIGDGFLTDILGARWMNMNSIQVATLPHKLHWWEKLLGKQVQFRYPVGLEIWKLGASMPEREAPEQEIPEVEVLEQEVVVNASTVA